MDRIYRIDKIRTNPVYPGNPVKRVDWIKENTSIDYFLYVTKPQRAQSTQRRTLPIRRRSGISALVNVEGVWGLLRFEDCEAEFLFYEAGVGWWKGEDIFSIYLTHLFFNATNKEIIATPIIPYVAFSIFFVALFISCVA